MNTKFSKLAQQLPDLLRELLECPPAKGIPERATRLPDRAVYMFSRGNDHLYVGRTNRLRARIKEHSSGSNNDAPFAFKLARYVTGHFKGNGGLTRKELEKHPEFGEVFALARIEVSELDWRWVKIDEPNLQCLFEIYATLALEAEFNDFENH